MKKLIFALFVLSVSASAFAAAPEFKLEKGDVTLRPIAGELMDVPVNMPNCPKPAVCDPAALIKVRYTLGCVNRLGPVSYELKYDNNDGKFDLYISAQEIVNENDLQVMCVRAPEAVVTIFAGMGFISKDQVRLHNLTNTATNVVIH